MVATGAAFAGGAIRKLDRCHLYSYGYDINRWLGEERTRTSGGSACEAHARSWKEVSPMLIASARCSDATGCPPVRRSATSPMAVRCSRPDLRHRRRRPSVSASTKRFCASCERWRAATDKASAPRWNRLCVASWQRARCDETRRARVPVRSTSTATAASRIRNIGSSARSQAPGGEWRFV